MALLLLAACSDHPTQSADRAEPVNAPTFSTSVRPGSVAVTDYGYIANQDGGDWTRAFQTAINSAGTVYVPQGDYYVSGEIYLQDGTRVHGSGPSSRILPTSGAHVFVAQGSPTDYVEHITVESLGFQGTSADNTALLVRGGRHVLFQNNRIDQMGVIVTQFWRWINTQDPTCAPNCVAAAGLTSASQLSSNIQVLNNTAVGAGPSAGLPAIMIEFSRQATIMGNHVSDYPFGIQWIGGDADPTFGGNPSYPRFAQNIWIEGNEVYRTHANIWGSMGDSVTVIRNFVQDCWDVCLDAEGSNRVLFAENHARNAGTAVLAVFYYSQDVHFVWNDARQDGSLGSLLFHTFNRDQQQRNTSILLTHNRFRWTSPTGFGVVSKEATRSFVFANNTLENTLLALGYHHNGAVSVTGNLFLLDRSTQNNSVIYIRNTTNEQGATLAPVNNGFHMEVSGNTIESTAPGGQGAAHGIHVRQESGVSTVWSWINGNTVKGFDPSIVTAGFNRTHTFYVESNKTTGTIQDWSSPAANVVNRNNQRI